MSERIGGLHTALSEWFAVEARDLPWRAPGRTPWGVLVSEVMLQQTPVARVLPVWREWMQRWPHPAELAGVPAGEAVRAWGRLGYPRRALRLHAAATVIAEKHGGLVPDTEEGLLALPGVGSYTAAAVAAFAFGRRTTVVDTNIRRVHARLVGGEALPAPSLTAAEQRRATDLLPDDRALSVTWNAATMELGAVVCTARSPRCGDCPVSGDCAWLAAGKPAPTHTPRGQAWHGTDRQVRGAIMAVLRVSAHPVPRELFEASPSGARGWPSIRGSVGAAPAERRPFTEGTAVAVDEALTQFHALGTSPAQLERSLAGLLADGLAVEADGHLRLP
ncbi:A/G-specific adenine glycosylase [Sinomonas notoginsengisoli]|uniref:A/G-specific adenine glycosylase n=1 Tax=Sinomonas notoginsengisoli TaxID=1457311 RepID=UPI001F43AB79|nr:A/G-specific adenine glycosylase [Sinomonas notoginsengisoli]